MKSIFTSFLLALLFTSCGGGMHWTERAAQDRIMLVRDDPPTLGHRRIAYQSTAHPDLGLFIQRKGRPDFIAETSADDRQYLVLYYLEKQNAFVCRSWRNQPNMIMFSGPQDITDKEVELLGELRKNASEIPDEGIAAGRMLVP